MSTLISIMVFGNSVGLCHMFLVAILLVWLCVFFITGDGYDMRSDVLASIATECTESGIGKEEKNNIEKKTEKYHCRGEVITEKKQKDNREKDRKTVEKKAV